MRSKFPPDIRSWVVVTLCLLLTACGVHRNQAADRVLVRTGTQVAFEKTETREQLPLARAYADEYLDYALLSQQAYSETLYQAFPDRLGNYEYEPFNSAFCTDVSNPTSACDDAALSRLANRRLENWRLIYASEPGKAAQCRRSRWSCSQQWATAGVQIWVHKGKVCKEAVIAFRGTQGDDLGEWHTNFRWITWLWPTYDAYKQVQEKTQGFVETLQQDSCWQDGVTKITAVGHSLGGGLPQQAAYQGGMTNGAASPKGRFHKVVVFDPSPVTGYYDINRHDRKVNSEGLRIEQVYEDGETLAYVRFLVRQIFPLSACNPQIISVRFNVLEGRSVAQHKLAPLVSAMLRWSLEQKASSLPAKKAYVPKSTACT
ncbi:hypothetical protein C8J38_11117 [Rhizobium sp. PP-WC-2G-219]|nr:hypothetical protein C8J38_11117 [Rhizobium sp. PP-WC-2G-219]